MNKNQKHTTEIVHGLKMQEGKKTTSKMYAMLSSGNSTRANVNEWTFYIPNTNRARRCFVRSVGLLFKVLSTLFIFKRR